MKTFDAPSSYEDEIRLLLPGYEALHTIALAVLEASLPQGASRVLVVGCGTGTELITLACRCPDLQIDALEPSRAMADAARWAIAQAGLEQRITIQRCTLEAREANERYDAALCLLVGHFLPDDGRRLGFLEALARSLRVGAPALIAELEDLGAGQARAVESHLRWSRSVGLAEPRLEVLEQRMRGGFAALTPARLEALCEEAGLELSWTFFQALSLVGRIVIRRAGGADGVGGPGVAR